MSSEAIRSATSSAPRRARLVEGFRARGCDAALLVGSGHAAHLLGYQRVYSGPLAQLIDAEGRTTLIVPVYEVDAARECTGVEDVRGYGEPGFGLDLAIVDKLVAVASGLVPRGRLAVSSELAGVGAAIASAAGVEHEPIEDLVHDVRLIKDAEELRRIVRAYELALVGQAAVEAASLPGAREIELYAAAQAAAHVAAGAVTDFGADLLIGDRSALVCGPVAVPGTKEATDGDVVVADVSVRHEGAWGDTARTFIVGENDEAVAIRVSIREILDEAASMLRPGVHCSDVFAQVAAAIDTRHPGGSFPHHGGHGIGVTNLEDPHLIPADGSALEEGMVIAIEPGVYFAGRYGVREEDNYLVTTAGGIELRELGGAL
jgi:Xaa-Pro aminopeptidase